MRIMLFTLIGLVIFSVSVSATTWNSSFYSCRNITISENSGRDLDNWPIPINLTFSSNSPIYADIRFVDTYCDNGGNELYHWSESNNSAYDLEWVNVTSIPASTDTIISVYYDSSDTIQNSYFNGSRVFSWFDDFNIDTLNKYQVSGGAVSDFSINSGYLNISTTAGAADHVFQYNETNYSSCIVGIKMSSLIDAGNQQFGAASRSVSTGSEIVGRRVDAGGTQSFTLLKTGYGEADISTVTPTYSDGDMIIMRLYNNISTTSIFNYTFMNSSGVYTLNTTSQYFGTGENATGGYFYGTATKYSVDWFYVGNYTQPSPTYIIGNELSVSNETIIPGCSSGELSKTLYILNETSPFSSINGTGNAYLNYDDKTFNFTFTNDSYKICINLLTSNFSVDGQIQYTGNISGVYSSRDYYFENMVFDNISDNINLYLLPDSISSRITITVQDQYLSTEEGVIIKVLRWYPELGAYKIVAAPKTDSNGQTNTYLVAYDVDYAFILEKDGVTLDTKDRQKITSSELTLTITPTPSIAWPYYWKQMAGTAIYSESAGTITGYYADASGYLTGATMYVTKISALEKSRLCTIYNSSTPTGMFVCNVGNVSSSVVSVEIIANLSTGANDYYTLYSNVFDEEFYISKLFGNCKVAGNLGSCREGVFIAMFLVLIAVLIGIWNPVISILFMTVSLGITVLIGLYAISTMTLIGLICVALIMIWKMST